MVASSRTRHIAFRPLSCLRRRMDTGRKFLPVACLCFMSTYLKQNNVHVRLNLERAQKPDGRENVHVLRGHLRGVASTTAGIKFQAFVHVGIDSAPSFLVMQCLPRMQYIDCRSKILATNGTGSNGRRLYYFGICILAICGLPRVHLRVYVLSS